MDEPDGVAGVTSIKQSQPTLVEEVLAHESLGWYHNVLFLYVYFNNEDIFEIMCF